MESPDEFRFAMGNGDEIVLTRRDGLRCALSGFLTFTSVPALQVPGPVLPPGLPSGAAVITSYGAVGDGAADDTAAIQKVLDSGNPNVVFPSGKVYRVQGGGKGTSGQPDGALRVRSHTTLWLAGATVKLAPGQREFTSVFQLDAVDHVTFRGGRIDGSKGQQSPAPDRGQNGGCHGITVDGGRRLAFHDLELADCFVDGIYLRRGVQDVTLEEVKSTGNRRQGMSVINVDGLACRNCKFTGTGGQKPEAGVDIEPNHQDEANGNLSFEDCEFTDNSGAGLMSNSKAPLDRLTIVRCRFAGNRRGDDVDLALTMVNAVVSNVLIEDCDIERRIHLHGRDPDATFKNFEIRSNRLRGPHAYISTKGLAPNGSVRITGNQIASGRTERWALPTDEPGIEVAGNTVTPFE